MFNQTSFSTFEDRLPQKIIKILMYCILLVVSFIGNLLIIWATSRDIRLRSTTNILIANMAVSDLLVPLFAIPSIIYLLLYNGVWFIDGDFGLTLCKLAFYLPDVSLGVSIYSCVFIALDRFYGVVYPFRGGLSKGKLKYIILGIWVFSMAMISDYFVSFTLLKTKNTTRCVHDLTAIGVTTDLDKRMYILIFITLNIGIPLPVISFLYLRIALKLRETPLPGQTRNSTLVRQRQTNNAVKMSAVIVSLFYLNFLPFSLTILLSVFGHLDDLSPTARNDLRFSMTFILHSSCCYNFFIYLVFNKVYRQNFKQLLSKCLCIVPCQGIRFGADPFTLEHIELTDVDVDDPNDLK